MGAPAARTFEHARHWASLGHDVTVVTGFPNHPTGKIHPGYEGEWLRRENIEGIDVLRTWIYIAANKGFTRRVLNFLSFFFSSLIFGAWLTKRPDVVVGTSPQFFCAVAAWGLSVLKRVPFVFEVRDIWPQSAVELGALKNPLLIRALEAIEMFLYRRAALIVPVAESTREYLLEKGIPADKIRIIPNGIDAKYLDLLHSASEDIRAELGLNEKFIISYIGTHGMSHALEILLQAAKRLEADPSLYFLLVGEGAEKERLKALAADLRLKNLSFIDQQARKRLVAFYRASDASIVPLRRLEIFTKVLPSKLFELMGAECPIICSVEGEAARLVQRAAAGLCIEPENVDALVAAIRKLQSDETLRQQLAANGAAFVRNHYLRSQLAEQYLEALRFLEERGEGRGARGEKAGAREQAEVSPEFVGK